MDTIQTIGKITLDYTDYPGEDYYCDGLVEDELLQIAKEYSPVEFPKLIEEKKSWPVMYHLSSQRENIVSWLPITKDMKVLEIGSGCGAITGALASKAGSVTCIDLSKKRSLINAHRHEDCDNVTIKIGNFKDVEPKLEKDYDCALLIGVLEYGASYIGGETPFEDFIRTIRKHVKKTGTIIIAIENRFGMKYWAGCREDHIGDFFSNIEGYPDGGCATTFSRKDLERICKAAGEKKANFYYPYPDYKFMTTLYSDDRLPMVGELINNNRNFDRDRMKLFDEARAFDGVIKEGLFPFYSNSFLVVLGNKPDTEYIRYSNDRAKSYQIATEILHEDIVDEKTGETTRTRVVKKHALSNEAKAHIQNMKKMEPILRARYDTEKLSVNPILKQEEQCVTFAYETGTMLTEYFDELLKKGDVDGFVDLFMEYVERIGRNGQMIVTDYDMVFSNILVQGENWKLIDYEWTYEKHTPVKEIAFRALYCYLLENENRNKFNFDLILQKLSITPDEADGYRERELRFQKTVTGKRLSMPQLRELIGGAVIVPQKSLMNTSKDMSKKRVQIYLDEGDGFTEDTAFFLDEPYDLEGNIELTFEIPSTTKRLRVDPCMHSCIVKLIEVTLNGEVLPITEPKFVLANGKILLDKEHDYVTMMFGTEDPNVELRVSDKVKSTGNAVLVRMQVVDMPTDMAVMIEKELKKKIRL